MYYSEMLEELEKIFTRLLNDKDCNILEFGGEEDHVHILFETPPQIQLSKLVNTLKTVSSSLIKKQYEQNLKKYYWKSAFWSRSYCIVSTGVLLLRQLKSILKIKVKINFKFNI